MRFYKNTSLCNWLFGNFVKWLKVKRRSSCIALPSRHPSHLHMPAGSQCASTCVKHKLSVFQQYEVFFFFHRLPLPCLLVLVMWQSRTRGPFIWLVASFTSLLSCLNLDGRWWKHLWYAKSKRGCCLDMSGHWIKQNSSASLLRCHSMFLIFLEWSPMNHTSPRLAFRWQRFVCLLCHRWSNWRRSNCPVGFSAETHVS